MDCFVVLGFSIGIIRSSLLTLGIAKWFDLRRLVEVLIHSALLGVTLLLSFLMKITSHILILPYSLTFSLALPFGRLLFFWYLYHGVCVKS
ncbi:hypothetical protein B0J14DRAFT_576919 [Halenospora varia]|nr:hypothetical protein B0J14DRAFT_576919 [Halenospora varia]